MRTGARVIPASPVPGGKSEAPLITTRSIRRPGQAKSIHWPG